MKVWDSCLNPADRVNGPGSVYICCFLLTDSHLAAMGLSVPAVFVLMMNMQVVCLCLTSIF